MARGFSYAQGATPEVVAAQAEDLSREQLLTLGSSSNKFVREAVAARADCPLGLMVSLAHDHVPAVRIAVASNPIASQTVMAYLSADRSVDVVTALLSNPSLPNEIVDELAFHRKSGVRAVATARLNSPEHSASAVEDEHTPELRDRAFGGPRVESPPTPEPAKQVTNPEPVGQAAVPEGGLGFRPVTGWDDTGATREADAPAVRVDQQVPAPERQAPTRTAPVRGFRPPKD